MWKCTCTPSQFTRGKICTATLCRESSSTTSGNILTASNQHKSFILTSASSDTSGTNYCRSDFLRRGSWDGHLHMGNFGENMLRINTLKDTKGQFEQKEKVGYWSSQQSSANPRWTTPTWTELKSNPESRWGGWLDSYAFTPHWRLTALRKVGGGDLGWEQLFTKVSSQGEGQKWSHCLRTWYGQGKSSLNEKRC